MNENEIEYEYFEWLYSLVCENDYCERYSYRELLRQLASIDFRYSIPMDANRASDGKNLRYKFRYANGYTDPKIIDIMSSQPCSVLEMIIGIARRMEDDYMKNSLIGDRTGLWFWKMLDNIGISNMHDGNCYEKFVDEKIDILLDRNFKPNGEGGLFIINNCSEDLRTVEFWTQACWYISTIINS